MRVRSSRLALRSGLILTAVVVLCFTADTMLRTLSKVSPKIPLGRFFPDTGFFIRVFRRTLAEDSSKFGDANFGPNESRPSNTKVSLDEYLKELNLPPFPEVTPELIRQRMEEATARGVRIPFELLNDDENDVSASEEVSAEHKTDPSTDDSCTATKLSERFTINMEEDTNSTSLFSTVKPKQSELELFPDGLNKSNRANAKFVGRVQAQKEITFDEQDELDYFEDWSAQEEHEVDDNMLDISPIEEAENAIDSDITDEGYTALGDFDMHTTTLTPHIPDASDTSGVESEIEDSGFVRVDTSSRTPTSVGKVAVPEDFSTQISKAISGTHTPKIT